jgi:signal transduction histidine kinase
MRRVLPEEQIDDEDRVRRELLGVMLAQNRTVLLGNLAIGVTSTVVLMVSGIGAGVLAWLAALVIFLVLRVQHGRRLAPRLATLGHAGVAAAERTLTLLLGACGLTWGLLPWLSYTGSDPFVDFFSIAMLVGMTAGAVNSAAALPRALNVYITGAFGPFIAKSASIGGLVYGAGGLTIAFAAVVLIAFGRNSHRALRQTLTITHRNQRLAEALRRERDAVQTAMRAKDLFLAGVTHDLRQPVHALALHLRVLRRLQPGALTPQALHAVCEPMETALKSMSSQLTRLLDLSRLEAGEARVARRRIELAEIFGSLAAQFEPQARDKGLGFRMHPLTLQVDSDPKMLQSIVDNLVANAVRYTQTGGVLVAARRRGTQLLLQVYDTGPGIAAEQQPHVFTAYRRFDDRQRSGDEGQGLGLALARKQAELLGHDLWLRSVPGRGSVFTLALGATEFRP